MPKTVIVTDTGCDLSDDLQKRYGITTVPLVVRFGQDVYLDGELTRDEFWAKAREGAIHPATSQPSVGAFEEAFAHLVARGYRVVCPVLTSKHSGTLNSAYTASQRFPGRVTVFDTLSASLGQGYQAIAAAKAAAAGRRVSEIMTLLRSIRARTHLFACLDTIEYVRRGGRLDQMIPVLERLVRRLNIKALLQVVEGQIRPLGAARSRTQGMQRIVQEVARHKPVEMLFAIHTRAARVVTGFARSLAEQLNFPFERVMIAEAGPALSSHAGPGVIAAGVVEGRA